MKDNSKKPGAKTNEEIIQEKRIDPSLDKPNLNELVEKLSNYQIELEKQNQELIRSQELLKQSEERFQLLFNKAPLGYQSLDINGFFIEVNQQWLETLGYERDEVIGKWFGDFLTPTFQDGFRKRFPIFKAQGHIHSEFEMIHKNGSILFIAFDGKIGNDVNGNFLQTHCILKDITEQRNAETALLKSEERFNLAMKASNDGLFDWNLETNNIYYSPGWKKMLGYEDHELPNDFSVWENRTDPDDVKKSWELQQKLISREIDRFVLVFKMKHKDGHWVDILSRAEAFFNKDGKAIRIVGTHTDISDSKKAEDALKESEIKLSAIFENDPTGIFIIHQRTRTIFDINDAALKFFGGQKEDIINKECHNFLCKSDKGGCPICDLGQTIDRSERILLKPDGTEVPILKSVVPFNINGENYLLESFIDISEQKKSEEKVIKIGKHFQALIDKAPDGIALIDAEGKFKYISESAKKMFGFSKNDEIKINPDENTHPDDLPMVLLELSKVFADPNYIPTIEYRFMNKVGQWIWIETTFSNLLADENVEAIVLNFRDVTERKLNEAIFKDIVDKNPIAIQITDMDGFPIQENKAHKKLFGEKKPSDYSVLSDPQLIENGFNSYFDRIKKGEVVHFPDFFYHVYPAHPLSPLNSVWVSALGFTLNDTNGTPEKIVLMHENITERKNAETLLNDIINNNPMSIQVVDKEGHTLQVNPAFIKLFASVPPPEYSIFEDLKRKSPELEDLVNRVKKGETVHLPDIYFNPHDSYVEAPDVPRWIRALIFPLNDSIGKPERFVLMHENITDRKKAELELVIAKEQAEESDRLKSAFLANMSHEIRTPMNGILGFAELLKEPDLSGEEQQQYLKIIEKSGIRMLNIINDIIDISKIEAGLMKLDKKETNINEQIEYIYTFFKPEVESKGMTLTIRNSLPAMGATIITDREKLYAILTNLVKNAIKYSNEGTIEIGYILQTASNPYVVEFYVKDTGIGIPKDRKEVIFERFIQADISDKQARQGAGLGLSISKAYVEMLNGKIWVESEEGRGSTFYFTLPYLNEPAGKTPIKQDPIVNSNIPSRKLKILIVEDDPISELFIEESVKKFSSQIIRATDGFQAIETCRTNPDIDLVLMDIRLPELNGYETTRQIREFNKKLIIIAQTAFGLSGDREKALEAGCNDYIPKPINKEDLLCMIDKYF